MRGEEAFIKFSRLAIKLEAGSPAEGGGKS